MVFVSDLHLRADRLNPAHDAAFAAFLRAMGKPSSHDLLIVILGDMADITGQTPSQLQASAEQIVRMHPVVFDAASWALAQGASLALVAGNHDRAWRLAAVRGTLIDRLKAQKGQVRFHPWQLYVAGRVYAEHGNLHHVLNALPQPLDDGDWGATDEPLGAVIEQYFHERAASRTRALARAAIGLSVHQARLFSPARSTDRRRYREYLRRMDDASGLPGPVLAELDELVTFGPLAMPERIIRKVLPNSASPRRAAMQRDDSYVRSASRVVDAVLKRHGLAVPTYVFGHTHLPADAAIDQRSGTRYLNSGAWSEPRGGQFPFVEITDSDRGLRWWDDESGTVERQNPG